MGETSQVFVQMWAEAVARQVEQVCEVRRKVAADGRAYERNEDYSPTNEDIVHNFRTEWAEEHTLIWAAYQLERWAQRLARERQEQPPPSDPVLAPLRNALEHLDDAEFEGGEAVPGPGDKNWSLRKLPDSRLLIATGQNRAFGLIDVDELEERALAVVRDAEERLIDEAESWWLDMESGR